MSCERMRLEIGADPAGTTPELEEHVRGCTSCRGFREEMRTLDGNIRRALTCWLRRIITVTGPCAVCTTRCGT